MRKIHRSSVEFLHFWPVTWKARSRHDVITNAPHVHQYCPVRGRHRLSRDVLGQWFKHMLESYIYTHRTIQLLDRIDFYTVWNRDLISGSKYVTSKNLLMNNCKVKEWLQWDTITTFYDGNTWYTLSLTGQTAVIAIALSLDMFDFRQSRTSRLANYHYLHYIAYMFNCI